MKKCWRRADATEDDGSLAWAWDAATSSSWPHGIQIYFGAKTSSEIHAWSFHNVLFSYELSNGPRDLLETPVSFRRASPMTLLRRCQRQAQGWPLQSRTALSQADL